MMLSVPMVGLNLDSPANNVISAGLTNKSCMNKIITLVVTLLAIPSLSALAADAKAIYEKDCAKCHGTEGKGDTKMGQKLGVKNYSDAKIQAEMKDTDMTKAIKEGVKKDGKTMMKAFSTLSDEEVKGLVAYVRALKK